MPPEAGSREVLGLLENKISEDAFSYYQRLGRVQDYVRVHYSAPITLADAARVAGLEKTYFSKFFHQKTGVRYHEWLTWVRVSRAIELMKRRNLSITEIAFAVGFSDLTTFERACRRCTGSTPMMLKKRLRPC
jgi:AraC-like DNA-binding protein